MSPVEKVRAALDFAGMRGASLIEISRASGLDGAELYTAIHELARAGELKRDSRPNSVTIHRLAKFLGPPLVRSTQFPPYAGRL